LRFSILSRLLILKIIRKKLSFLSSLTPFFYSFGDILFVSKIYPKPASMSSIFMLCLCVLCVSFLFFFRIKSFEDRETVVFPLQYSLPLNICICLIYVLCRWHFHFFSPYLVLIRSMRLLRHFVN
jgi:hypothetical protein